MRDFTIEVRFDRCVELSQVLQQRAALAVRKAAADIEATAKTLVAVDTGFLKSSILTTPVDEHTIDVGPHTDYAIYQEFGTRFQYPHPYMGPAADAVRPAFIAAMEQICK